MNIQALYFIVRFVVICLIVLIVTQGNLAYAFFAAGTGALIAALFDRAYGDTSDPHKHNKRTEALMQQQFSSKKDILAWVWVAISAPLFVLLVTAKVLSLFAGQDAQWIWFVGGALAVIVAWFILYKPELFSRK